MNKTIYLDCDSCGSKSKHIQKKASRTFVCQKCGGRRTYVPNPVLKLRLKCCIIGCKKIAVKICQTKPFCKNHDSTFTHSKQTGASPGEKLKQDKIN